MTYLSVRKFCHLSCLLLCVSLLTQCVAPALLLAPQGQLMWALLKPMVGLDPKEANLFRQPLIQSRLEPLLGSHYSGAVQLLETADKIQQEGPLFYVVSKYTPVPELAEKAGFVWNSETNQMAVLMVSGGAPQVFAEKLNNEVAEQIPVWPKELSDYTDPAKLQQQAINKAKQQLSDNIPVPAAVAPLVDNATNLKDIKGQTKNLLEEKKQSLVDKALSPLSDAKQQAQQQVQQVKEQSAEADLVAEDDLAAELATEQQSLKTEKSQRVNLLQQQIKAAEQQLQQASTTDDRKKIELQLQQLKTTLNLLKATD